MYTVIELSFVQGGIQCLNDGMFTSNVYLLTSSLSMALCVLPCFTMFPNLMYTVIELSFVPGGMQCLNDGLFISNVYLH